MKKYILEIYDSNTALDVVAHFESSTPFCGIEKGAIINPAFFHSYDNPNMVLIIANVEHIIWQHEGQSEPTQKLCVFTKAIENKAEVRIGG